MRHHTNASATTLRDFLDCRRRGRFNEFWQAKGFQSALFFGSAIHTGLEGYYSGDRDPQKGTDAFVKFCADANREFEEQLGYLWANEWPVFNELYTLGWRVLQNYWDYERFNPLEGEIVFVEKNHRYEIAGSGFTLSGRTDLVLRDSDGKLWVVDHKTSSEKLNQASLDVDEQLTAYAYLVWRATGEIPAGVIYNTILKKAPEPPLPLVKGGLSRAKGQLTSPAMYRESIKARGLDESDYADFLHYLETDNWSMYFSRDVATRNFQELMTFEAYVATKIRDVCSSIDDGWVTAYPSPSIYGCGYCPFIAPCKAMNDGGDWEAILTEKFIRR